MNADLVILGAGPAGVGAAYRAAHAGQRVVVCERSGQVGGAAGSFMVAGQRVDHGSHRLHATIDAGILAELRRLMGNGLQRRERRGRIRLAGRWIGFPLQPADVVRHLPPRFALGATVDAALSLARRAHEDTFAEVLRAGLGPTMCEGFYFPYARKLWGMEPEALSAEQARRRVTADSPLKLLDRVLRGTGGSEFFYYPAGGFGTITERLAESAVAASAELRLGATVARVELGEASVRVHTGDGEVVTARRVWSTLPLTVLAAAVDPPPPPRVVSAAQALRYRAMLLVYLAVDRDRYTAFDAHYLPEAGTPVTRVSEPKNYRDSPEDPPGRTVLCAEIPCTPGDGLWQAPDATLADVVVDTLAACDLPKVDPVEVVVRRLGHAYPIYDAGYEPAFAALDAWATELPRLLTFGRQGLFAHDNTHHALAMAWAAVDALTAPGGFDEATWSVARERFAAHVVDD